MQKKKRVRKSISVHTILAKIFIVNDDPEKKLFVDHIDCNKFNYSLSNLRWVTPSENSKNWKRKDSYSINKYRYESIDGSEAYSYNDISSKFRAGIYRSIKEHRKYKGKSWKIINLELENYYSRFSRDQLSSEKWRDISEIHKEIQKDTIYVSSLGVIKFKNSIIPTIGSSSLRGYRLIQHNKKGYRVHVLVSELFILNRLINKEEVVDHLTSNTSYNAV